MKTGALTLFTLCVCLAPGPASADVQVRAVDREIFRLEISAGDRAEPLPSIFLDPARREDASAATAVSEGPWRGLRNAAGELLTSASGDWSLRDAAGRVLVGPSAIRLPDRGDANPAASIEVDVASGGPMPGLYGSGNDTPSLIHRAGPSGVGNGLATIPYFWSPAGYAMLVVGADDAEPARWTLDPDGRKITWTVPGKTADLYLMPARDLKSAAIEYGRISGRPPVPPVWAFGYLQSRWGWKDQAYIEDALRQFRTRSLPVDAFIFDFEWYTPQPDYKVPSEGTPGFSDFGWNPLLFPDPARQIAAFHAQGLRVVAIRKPRLGDRQALEFMHRQGWALPPPPGEESYHNRDMDFRNPALRKWYADHLAPMLDAGIDGWWNDEGEATFVNYYYWNLAEIDAASRKYADRRFWTINRAFEPGLQRLGAAAWTGDIESTWGALAATPASLLNWSLAGMPYGACDIGGFKGEDSPELLARWMEAGVFFPVMRAHSAVERTPRFPWLYGPGAESAIRRALDLRSRLVPYYYSLAHEASQTGIPLMRPVLMEYPDDARAADLSDQWFMGDGLMAAPLLAPGGRRQVYLPAGTWHRFESTEPLAGGRDIAVTASLDEIPCYVRAGTILPLGPALQTTADARGGPLDVQIYPGRDASFTLAEDDGETKAYERGEVRRTMFSWDDARQILTWREEGPYSGGRTFKSLHVTLFSPAGIVQRDAPLETAGRLVL